MSEFINTIDVLGDDVVVARILDGTITEFYDNQVLTVGDFTFYGCNALTTVDLSVVTSMGDSVFAYCNKLKTLVLRSSTVCTLQYNANNFTGSEINKGTGYIYVPRALVDSYKAASNWTPFANQFRALEDYTVDGTTTGELDESKI